MTRTLKTVGGLVRPFKVTEATWSVAGAALLVAFQLLPWPDGLSAVGKGTDVRLLLAGMMLRSESARPEGLFDWLSAFAVHLVKGSQSRRVLLVYAVGGGVTTFPSNDAAADMLTAAVLAAARNANAKPLPNLSICAFIANAAGFVLPISNPANLVLYGEHMRSQRADLVEGCAARAEQNPLTAGGWTVLGGTVCTVCTVFGWLLVSWPVHPFPVPTCVLGTLSAGRCGLGVAGCVRSRTDEWLSGVQPASCVGAISGDGADMKNGSAALSGPDFASGFPLTSVEDGKLLLGHAKGEAVILVRQGDTLRAVGAVCTHYGAPLADGLLVGETVRCPWHHACFSLINGKVLRAPALAPIACWKVEQRDGIVYVREKTEQPRAQAGPAVQAAPKSNVIVGGGGAGNAAAEMLRQLGYAGRITMLSADASVPYDRPNLSKGGLAGNGTAEVRLPRSAQSYRDQGIDLRLNARVARIDVAARQVELQDGSREGWDALLLATGADPVRLALPGADLPHVHYLRTAAEGDALIAAAQKARHAVVIGASFIGLEVAASLRARERDVQVVGREAVPMEKVLGPEVGRFIHSLHEQHGVGFHLGCMPVSIDGNAVILSNGERLAADLVVIGVGVRPNVALAQQAGLEMDGASGGVSVDEHLETSVPGIYAAGDIAAWPDPLSNERIRVEHWVVAQRQGQTAARNMLGASERFTAVPFFWTEQYDFGLAYVGHAVHFDTVDIEGSLDAQDCKITYLRGDHQLAVAVVHRDLEGLRAEVEFERLIATSASAATPATRSSSIASAHGHPEMP